MAAAGGDDKLYTSASATADVSSREIARPTPDQAIRPREVHVPTAAARVGFCRALPGPPAAAVLDRTAPLSSPASRIMHHDRLSIIHHASLGRGNVRVCTQRSHRLISCTLCVNLESSRVFRLLEQAGASYIWPRRRSEPGRNCKERLDAAKPPKLRWISRAAIRLNCSGRAFYRTAVRLSTVLLLQDETMKLRKAKEAQAAAFAVFSCAHALSREAQILTADEMKAENSGLHTSPQHKASEHCRDPRLGTPRIWTPRARQSDQRTPLATIRLLPAPCVCAGLRLSAPGRALQSST